MLKTAEMMKWGIDEKGTWLRMMRVFAIFFSSSDSQRTSDGVPRTKKQMIEAMTVDPPRKIPIARQASNFWLLCAAWAMPYLESGSVS